MELTDRFWSKVRMTHTCWVWTASRHPRGYGHFRIDGRTTRAHTVAYEWMHGAVPDGLVLDHLCRNTWCVNPDHLEAVTQGENVRRGDAGQYLARRTHCKNGHEWTPENTRRDPDGCRLCAACARERVRQSRLRKLAGR